MKLKKFGVMSLAKMEAALFAILLFFEALIIFPFMLLGGGLGLVFGIVMLIGFPIVGAIVGFIAGAIAALVYNFVAGKVGGIEMEFDQ